MRKNRFEMEGIPALLWGDHTERLFIAVHGNLSSKDDTVIELFAREAAQNGFQTLSFDLPEHGERRAQPGRCTVQHCMADLARVLEFARLHSNQINLFACSMGAYFSLLSFRDVSFERALFLSPILNMERLIRGMMAANGVSEERLKNAKDIPVPNGPPLSWEYFEYVCLHPVDRWQTPTSILYGSNDNLTDRTTVENFIARFGCQLQIMQGGEHFFHTPDQLRVFREWVSSTLKPSLPPG